MSTTPMEALRVKASEQRNRLHKTASDLRVKVQETREQLSPAKQVHDHLLAASLIGAVAAFFSGYFIMGLFTRN
jgi:hypothetical protein